MKWSLVMKRFWCEEPVIRIVIWSLLAREGLQLFLSHDKGPLVFGRNDIVESGLRMDDKFTWGKFHVDIVAYHRQANTIIIGNIASILYAWIKHMDLDIDFHRSYTRYVFCPIESSRDAYEFLSQHNIGVKASLAVRMHKSVVVVLNRYGRVRRILESSKPLIAIMAVLPFYAPEEAVDECTKCIRSLVDRVRNENGIDISYYAIYVFRPWGKIKDLPKGVELVRVSSEEFVLPDRLVYEGIKRIIDANGCTICRYKETCIKQYISATRGK